MHPQAKDACNAAGVSHPCDLASKSNDSKDGTIQAVIAYVTTLMAEDKKSTGLKALQVIVLLHLMAIMICSGNDIVQEAGSGLWISAFAQV